MRLNLQQAEAKAKFHSEPRQQLAWGFYDWANSAFATTVMAGFFPIFFKQYWASGLSATDSTFQSYNFV